MGGFPALLVCVASLGIAFGAAGVIVPAFAGNQRHRRPGQSLAGLLLAVWGVGSAVGGFWFGARRPAANVTRQFAWLLAAVAGTLAIFAVMPGPLALGIALVVGGATIAPALTVENTLVGRIAPAGMLNEAYTWVVTVSVAASAAGGAVAGLIVDRHRRGALGVPLRRRGGRRRSRAVAALPGGPIARAEAAATRAEHPVTV